MEAEAERRAELKRAADLVGLALAVAEVNAGNVNLGQLSQLIVGQKFDERRRREAQRPSERGMLSYCKARQVRSVCRSPQRGALACQFQSRHPVRGHHQARVDLPCLWAGCVHSILDRGWLSASSVANRVMRDDESSSSCRIIVSRSRFWGSWRNTWGTSTSSAMPIGAISDSVCLLGQGAARARGELAARAAGFHLEWRDEARHWWRGALRKQLRSS